MKMLARNANLDVSDVAPGPPAEQDIPLNIPKKTRLYLEQTEREKDCALDMHRIFQRDLCKLRLSTAKAYVKVITDSQGPVSNNGSAVRLNVSTQGLGPLFKVKLNIRNTGPKPIFKLPVSFSYNVSIYSLSTSLLHVSILICIFFIRFLFCYPLLITTLKFQLVVLIRWASRIQFSFTFAVIHLVYPCFPLYLKCQFQSQHLINK